MRGDGCWEGRPEERRSWRGPSSDPRTDCSCRGRSRSSGTAPWWSPASCTAAQFALQIIQFKYVVANATLFDFLFHRFVMRRVHFRYSNFLLGGCMVMWMGGGLEACLIWRYIDVIVFRVKVSRGIVPFSPMGIDSADTNQPSNGEICMDKSHLLPNNPARQ